MDKEQKLAEAGHRLRAMLDRLDGSGTGAKAAVHIQWAIDLIDEELKAITPDLAQLH